MVIYDYRRTKRKTTSLLRQFPDIFGLSFVLSVLVSSSRLGLELRLGYMKFAIYITASFHEINSHDINLQRSISMKFPLVKGFRTHCIYLLS